MRTLVSLIAASLVLGACMGQSESPRTEATNRSASDALRELLADESGSVMVVAHRACWLEGAPENSLAAISACIEMGVEMIEIDVRLTSDGVPVLIHDNSLDRTTDGTGNIGDMTYAKVQTLSLREGAGGPSAPITTQTIPMLSEALDTAKGHILINLDVKLDIFDDAFTIVQELGVEDQILMKMGVAADDPALSSAAFVGKTLFMPLIRQCTETHLARGTYCVSAIADAIPEYDVYDPIAYEITYIDPDFLTVGVASMAASSGRIWVNALSASHAAGHTDDLAKDDPDAHWGQIVEHGANMIQTDRPRELIDYLANQGLR